MHFMKLLLFTPQLPFPPHQGTTIRNFYLIKYLARHHTIDLITFLAPGQQLATDNPLYQYCRQIYTMPQPVRTLWERAGAAFISTQPDMALRLENNAMRALVDQLDEAYDIIQFEGIEMAQYGLQAHRRLSARQADVRLVFDDHNCEYLLQKRNALTDLRQPKRWLAGGYSLLQWLKLRRYEAAVCRAADIVTAVSGPDQTALEALVPGLQVTVVPNGIAPEAYDPTIRPVEALSRPWKLLFTGKMDYRPNVDAMIWFGEEVLPLIQQQEPGVQLQIVGMNPHARLNPLHANPAITITGAVESISPYLADAAVYVVPLRVGGGTRFKVLEAMAQGLPIVSTHLGVEGLNVTDGRELLLASAPSAFAEAVVHLLADRKSDGSLAAQLGRQARAFVEENYSWESIMPQLEACYRRNDE